MSNVYRIFGAELSPYSVKVRSYCRYKGIPHEWAVRGPSTEEEFRRHAKLPLIPVVVTPEGEALQDSTPILERLEERFPDPSIHPEDPALAFLSALVEEFGDEWGNKWMFHYRWAREVDQESAAERLAATLAPDAVGDALRSTIAMIRGRMVDRVWFVGSNAETAPQIEESFLDTIRILDAHLASRPYLFGGRPAFGDFGLWGQIYNAYTDPTPGGLIRARAPRVVDWIERLLDPKPSPEGFESWTALESTLTPLLERQIGGLFLPWSDANARAIAAAEAEFSVSLPSGEWTQRPQKYHAKSLGALRERYVAMPDRSRLDPILERSGCLAALRGAVGD